MSEIPRVQTTSAQAVPSTTNDLMRFEIIKKSEGVALCLCWGLGVFGGHRFYLGRPHAATMLIITLISLPLCLFCCLGIPGILATFIWMICDLFQVTRWVREYNTAILANIQSVQPAPAAAAAVVPPPVPQPRLPEKTTADLSFPCPLCGQHLMISTVKRGENYCPHCSGKFLAE